MWVGIKDLELIADSTVYKKIEPNADQMHPSNHYLSFQARIQLTYLAALYRVTFPDDSVLHLNDASLERGGLFDVKAKDGVPWKTPHPTHRFGTEIDIRANSNPGAIPEENFEKFEELVKEAGAARNPRRPNTPAYKNDPSNRHYHICLTGGSC